ncbi:MAG: hypothetical protein LBI33_13225 [Propionibacteriaceae bacterium]|jgi:hypothetical protein|nr:hypothetical protein [Propionibacteriaceae bacterium]
MLTLPKSPSGSLCPYYYLGGELHPLKYGSYFDRTAELLAVMQAEEAFILASPGSGNRRIWLDLCETRLDDEVVGALVAHLHAIKPKTHKLCLVGCSAWGRRRIIRAMKRLDPGLAVSTRFFADPEVAKQWLVGKAPV